MKKFMEEMLMSKPTQSSEKKKKKKPALGRGLGSLLGEQTLGQTSELDKKHEISRASIDVKKVEFEAEKQNVLKQNFVENKQQPNIPDTARIWQVPIEKLKGNPNQPRKDFDSQALKELADSIRKQGILQPIVARKMENGNYQIIAGERRWRASQQAGLHEVPVVLKESTDQKALELALIENIQREDLNPMEEAEAYEWFIKTYNLTQQALAEKIGKDRVSIANSLRLMKLHPDLRTYLRVGELSSGQAKVLLSLEDPVKQKKVGFEVLRQKLTVRETEKLVAKAKISTFEMLNENSASSIDEMDVSAKLVKGLSQELQKILGTRVAIDYKSGKGKLKINFYSDAELDNLVEKIREAWKK